jgi:uncharacterized membrane protein required for colicin V production
MTRGFTLQLVGIAQLTLSLVAATLLSEMLGKWIRSTEALASLPERAAHYLSFLAIFIAALAIGSLIANLMKGMFEDTRVVPFDRLLGGLLGGLKAVLVIMVIVIGLANLFYDEDEEAPMRLVTDVITSRSATVTRLTAEHVGVVLPKGLAEVFERYSQRLLVEPTEGSESRD